MGQRLYVGIITLTSGDFTFAAKITGFNDTENVYKNLLF